MSSSHNRYYVNALCAYMDLLAMPAILVGVYMYSHDKSTLTWLYLQYPKLFDQGLALCYPLYLMHWPVGTKL